MWPVYLINLARDTRRMENSAREFDQAGIAFERIEAVDGKLLTPEDLRHYRYWPGAWHRLLPSEIGCHLSHLRLWERIAQDYGHDGAFIFEDDFLLTSDTKRIMESLINQDGPWDMAKLYNKGHYSKDFTVPADGYSLVYGYRLPTGTQAYGVTRTCARKLVRKLSTFNKPVDQHICRYWELGIIVAAVQPNAVLSGDETTADGSIGEHRYHNRSGIAYKTIEITRRKRLALRWRLEWLKDYLFRCGIRKLARE